MSPDEFAAQIAGLVQIGLSRTEIARETHLSRTTVWRAAKGYAVEPRHSTVEKVERLRERTIERTVRG